MPPEHETLLSALCCISYGAKQARRLSDPERARTWLLSCRRVLLRECRKLGPNGRDRVGLRVLHGVDRIIVVTRPVRKPAGGWVKRQIATATWSTDWHKKVEHVVEACDVGLRAQRLSRLAPSTWTEQIAGRATLMAKHQWPELMDA